MRPRQPAAVLLAGSIFFVNNLTLAQLPPGSQRQPAAPLPIVSAPQNAVTPVDTAAARKQAADLTRELRKLLANRANSPDANKAAITDCLAMLAALGEPGIDPICTAARDAQSSNAAVGDLALMLDSTRPATDSPIRPIAVSSLTPASLASLGRLVAGLKTGATSPGNADAPPVEDCVGILAALAPRLPAAMAAMIDLASADAIPKPYRVAAASAAFADPANRRRLETAAAKGGETGQHILKLFHFWALPPDQAAAQIAAMSEDEQRQALGALPADVKWSGALLNKLLSDPKFSDRVLASSTIHNAAVVQSALNSTNPLIRVRAAALLPDEQAAQSIQILAQVTDAGTSVPDPVRERILMALYRTRDLPVPAIIAKTKGETPALRAAAARAIGWLGVDNDGQGGPSPAMSRQAAEALLAMTSDADLHTRICAVAAAGRLSKFTQPLLAVKLKTLSDDDRKKFVRALATSPPADGEGIDGVGITRALAMVEAISADKSLEASPIASQMLRDRQIEYADAMKAAQPIKPMDASEQAALSVAKAPGDIDGRTRAMQTLMNSKDPAIAIAVRPLLTDPEWKMRVAAARYLVQVTGLIGNAENLQEVLKLRDADPVREVRSAVEMELAQQLSTLASPDSLSRLQRMAAAGDAQRAAVVEWLGMKINVQAALRPEDQKTLSPLVSESLASSSAPVRRAASSTAASWVTVSFDANGSAVILTVKALHDSDAGVRAAALDGVWLLPLTSIQSLTANTDPQLRVAALLAVEQPANVPRTAKRAPFDDAVLGLRSPSHRVRQMAAISLSTTDPADPTRASRGLPALIAAGKDPNPDIALDTLDTLVYMYCGPLVPDPETHSFVRTFSGNAPKTVPFPIYLTNIVKAAMTGETNNRLTVIHKIGISEPKFLAGRWDLFRTLLVDPNPQIRADAAAAAQTVTGKAIEEYKKKQAPGAVYYPPGSEVPGR